MAIPNRISAVVTDEQLVQFKTALETAAAQLPLIDLTPEERDKLVHLKDRNYGFVKNARLLVAKKSDFLPGEFKVDEFQKDAVLFDRMFEVRQLTLAFLQRIEDTLSLCGNEAYAAALLVYASANLAGVKTDGIDPYVDEMARRFARKSKPSGSSIVQPSK